MATPDPERVLHIAKAMRVAANSGRIKHLVPWEEAEQHMKDLWLGYATTAINADLEYWDTVKDKIS